jgi:hypothetical protein
VDAGDRPLTGPVGRLDRDRDDDLHEARAIERGERVGRERLEHHVALPRLRDRAEHDLAPGHLGEDAPPPPT